MTTTMTTETISVEDTYVLVSELAVNHIKHAGSGMPRHELSVLHKNSGLWYDSLIDLKAEVQIQLADRKAKLRQARTFEYDDPEVLEDIVRDHENWRIKTLRFLTQIEKEIRMVKRHIKANATD